VGNGYDAAQEDSFRQTGMAALEGGWNVMTYEGPGQPTVRREQGLGFNYDWESVVTPAVDYLANRSDVDMSRLALAGVSMGGYLAVRAATFQPRIKALVLNEGVYDVQASFIYQFGPQLTALYESGNKSAFDAILDAAVLNNNSATSAARWGLDQGLWSFKTHSTTNCCR
jgi:pimeloyl-ACP methyl ester carboxylesterase